MSTGYNMAFDLRQINEHKKHILQMEKEHPNWEPELFHTSKFMSTGRLEGGGVGGFKPAHQFTATLGSFAPGPRSTGFNNQSVYNNFYKESQKGYKSSGNQDIPWYSENELVKINKRPMATPNFNKPQTNNTTKNFKGKPHIFKSILDVMDGEGC